MIDYAAWIFGKRPRLVIVHDRHKVIMEINHCNIQPTLRSELGLPFLDMMLACPLHKHPSHYYINYKTIPVTDPFIVQVSPLD